MKKVLISGYYGFNNAGDELVLQEVIRGVKEYLPDSEITILSGNPEETIRKDKVKAVHRWGVLSILKSVFHTDLLISGGGSLLQDKTSKNSILYYLGIMIVGKLMGKKVILLSQGIGPITNSRNVFLTKVVLNKIDYISVRDKDSQELLKQMGIKKDVAFSADPVFLLPDSSSLDQQNILWEKLGLIKNKKLILVSFRPWKNIENIIPETRAYLETFSPDEYQVRFVPFHYGEDEGIIKDEIFKDEVIKSKLEPKEFVTLIASSHLVIGMRLHALIIAATLGVKFIGISYDPKVSALDREIYGEECQITTENITKEMLAKKEQIVMNTEEELEKIKERAKIPFTKLKDLFN